jgi:hypothetical protein
VLYKTTEAGGTAGHENIVPTVAALHSAYSHFTCTQPTVAALHSAHSHFTGTQPTVAASRHQRINCFVAYFTPEVGLAV